jgi:Formin Homology 2 Domain
MHPFSCIGKHARSRHNQPHIATAQVRASAGFAAALVATLALGNYLNAGTTNGDAVAFKFEALVKLADTKSLDGDESLLSFLARALLDAGHAPLPAELPALLSGTMETSMEARAACAAAAAAALLAWYFTSHLAAPARVLCVALCLRVLWWLNTVA